MIDTILNGLKLDRNRPMIIHECGRCGTTLDDANVPCPYCGDARVVTFEL